jgi:signal transduction histidine kinase
MHKDSAATLDSAQLVASLFAMIPVPIAVADGQGRVILANSAFNEVFPGVVKVLDLPKHEVEVPGSGTFDIQTVPLNDGGFKIVYAADISNEAHLRRQVSHLEKMAAVGRLATEVARAISIDGDLGRASRTGLLDSLLILAGVREPRRVVIDLNAIVRNVVVHCGRPGKNEECSFELDLDEHLPRTIADGAQIEQVVMALLLQAETPSDSTSRSPRTIHIQTRGDAEKIQLHVSQDIRTTGIADETMADGVGMGLNVCAEIVREHGGELYMWSPYTGDATLTMELPVRS